MTFLGNTKLFGRHFYLFDSNIFKFCRLIGLFIALVVLGLHEQKVTIDQIDQEVREGYEDISSAQALALKGILATKNKITFKDVRLGPRHVLTILMPFGAQTVIDKGYTVKLLQTARQTCTIAHQDVF